MLRQIAAVLLLCIGTAVGSLNSDDAWFPLHGEFKWMPSHQSHNFHLNFYSAQHSVHAIPVDQNGHFEVLLRYGQRYTVQPRAMNAIFAPYRLETPAEQDAQGSNTPTYQLYKVMPGLQFDQDPVDLLKLNNFTQVVPIQGYTIPVDYFTPREGFSLLGTLMNPMVLMMLVTMLLMFGMPKLMENMDPETMQELREQQQRANRRD